MTYKAIGQSVLEYANPRSLIIGESNWKRLRVVQNYALKIATGCHKMTHTDHVHTECKMIPIKKHCELITDQFLLSNYRPGHPGNRLINNPSPKRRIKPSVIYQRDKVSDMLPVNDDKMWKVGLKTLHTRAVGRAISSYSNNRVLGGKLPKIHKSERELSRKESAIMSQLRSGFSILQVHCGRHCS